MTEVSRTRWDGLVAERVRASGYFRVEQIEGVWWFVDPDGGLFLSKGVNTVNFDHDGIQNTNRYPYREACQQKYGSRDVWRATAAQRLRSWGFNTLGSWSDDEAVAGAAPAPLAVTPNLDLGMSFAWQTNDRAEAEPKQDFPDVFDPAFDTHIRRRAREHCAARSGEPGLIGWFIDNELRWGADWRGPDELLTLFLRLSPATPGRIAASRLAAPAP